MNKELEAFERIKATIELNVKDYFYWEEFGITIPLDKEEMFNDLNLIREVLKRNEPMKIKHENNYCGYCGQKLDWSKDWSDEK